MNDHEEHDDQYSVEKSDSELSIEATSPEIHDRFTCFKKEYNCFPLSHINKTHLEDGNRILMPASALHRLMSMNIEYPMVFKIKNSCTKRVSHCGVLEFSAEEGSVFLPDWMMKNLQLQEGNLVTLKSTTLPKGTFMKIQPHTMKFLGIPDPKSVLETALRDFSCLTTGDTITLTHDHNQYYMDILETKPSSAISVVETDCEVEFAPPLDYKEPFTGVARRLDGKPLIAPVADSISTSMLKEDGLVAAHSNRPRKRPGKLVFGPEGVSQSEEKSTRVSKEDHEERTLKDDKKKFQPFKGKKHTLGG